MKHLSKKIAVLFLGLLMVLLCACGKKNEEIQALDYTDQANWAIYEEDAEKAADLFLICPTVDMGRDGNFNMSMENEKMKDNFLGALNMERGIYEENANIMAPYYRQITFPVYSMSDDEAAPYIDLAYADVKAAFEEFLADTAEDRPIVLAGFSQGSQLLIRLMEDYFSDPDLQDRLVAAYLIGWRVTEEDLKSYPFLKMAQGPYDVGVIVTFNSETEETKDSLLVPEGEFTYGINPLNWKTDNTVADKSENKGACFTDYSGTITNEVSNLCGAYLDPERGTLKVLDVTPQEYPGVIFDDGIYHLYDYQFFYRNLQENVTDRINAWENN